MTDPGIYDTHTVVVDWGDGQSESIFIDSYGYFDAWHTYEDDDPTGTSSDVYTITVTATDDDTGVGDDTAQITVTNVAPTLYFTDYYTEITDGIELTVEGDFTDVDADSHTLTIDWGDGTSDTLAFGSGSGSGGGSSSGVDRTFSLTHNYTDPNANPDWEVSYNYTITVEDDDLGVGSGSGSGSASGSGNPLVSAPPPPESTVAERLRISEIIPVFEEAVSRWEAVLDHPLIERSLREVVVQIADLPEGQLGFAVQNQIIVDLNANGFGWFVDATPDDDAEFAKRRDGELHALRRSEAYGRMDLLTVLMHELGHVIGIGHTENDPADLMDETLPVGVRRLPESVQLVGLSPKSSSLRTESGTNAGEALFVQSPVYGSFAHSLTTSSDSSENEESGDPTLEWLPPRIREQESLDEVFATIFDFAELMPFE